MAWIKVIAKENADPQLKKVYDEVGAARGLVSNILKIHSLHPEVLAGHLALYRELMFGRSELTRTERELIALSVSSLNKCHY